MEKESPNLTKELFYYWDKFTSSSFSEYFPDELADISLISIRYYHIILLFEKFVLISHIKVYRSG